MVMLYADIVHQEQPNGSIIGCLNCPFKTQRIGGKGPIDSPFVIVGESPGATELARKIPFVGPSGQMLDQILAEVGFGSLGIEPYVTNAISCYPVDKDIPTMQHATSCCEARLHAELLKYPREVILCLGASATWSVTGNYGLKITRDRGKILKSRFANKGVVLAVHPSYLIRNGGGLPFWKKDLKSAVQLMEGTLISHWREPTWEVIETRQHLQKVVEEYTSQPDTLVTGDFETTGLQALFNEVLILGITKGLGDLVHIITEEAWYNNLDLIKTLMESQNIKWNWHNGKFDIQWAWASDPRILRAARKHGKNSAYVSYLREQLRMKPYVKARVDEDTMLLSYTLNENAGFHDLDQVAQAWIGAPSHKEAMDKYYKMKPHYSLRNAPKEELYKYAAFDIAKTHKQWFVLREEVNKDARLKRLYEKTLIPASGFFARMETYGVLVDKNQVMENVQREDAEIARVEERLQRYANEHVGHNINFRSYIQLRELLYGKMKLQPAGQNAKTWPSDEDALVEVQRRTNHPIIHDLLEHREVTKRKGTYVINLIDHYKTDAKGKKSFVPGIISPDGRIHASYKIHGTTTGRPACTKPNLLNQPRVAAIRDQYVAKPGHVFVEVDLNQAELRSLCVLSKDILLTEIYTKNEISIHDTTTAAFFASMEAMEADEALMHKCADLMQYFGERTPKLVYKEAKMAGKTVNFGIVYGREAHSIAQVFNIPHQEAQRWIDTWLETYPQAAEYIRKCRLSVIRNQTMVTPFGRMKRNGVVSPEKLHDLENQAANFPHQSIAHDILLEAAMECEERLVDEWSAYCWNEVYDAIYYEVEADEQKVKASIDYVTEVITQVPIRYGLTHIPFLGDAKVGGRWGSMKDWKGSFEASGLKV